MIVFNRPDNARRVLDAVAASRPARLFVIADGARANRPGEAERVAETRALFDDIDWPCEVIRDFAPENLGCRRRIVTGLDRLFDQVESAIILEDDCVPVPAFFRFAETMLDRYRHDPRVFSIAGSNFAGETGPAGHYFSDIAMVWGWATWRDRWARYVPMPTDYEAILRRHLKGRPIEQAFWRHFFDKTASGEIDTWDYQLLATMWREQGLCCRPTRHLVANIGFGADATHTSDADDWLGKVPAEDCDGDFGAAPALVAADRVRDAWDLRHVQRLTLRSTLALKYPALAGLRRRLFPRHGEQSVSVGR